jgi:hypothetical protein
MIVLSHSFIRTFSLTIGQQTTSAFDRLTHKSKSYVSYYNLLGIKNYVKKTYKKYDIIS